MHTTIERRTRQPRYVFELPVQAEWRESATEVQWVHAEGHTTNIGPSGALVHLQPLPAVGSQVRLIINHDEAPSISGFEVQTLVLRVDHDAGAPLAALVIPELIEPESHDAAQTDAAGEAATAWLSGVYEPSVAAIQTALETPFTYSSDDDEDEDAEPPAPERLSRGRVR